MSLTKDVEVLRNIPLFAKVEPAKLKLLAFTSERLEYLAGDELFHQGDYGDAAYIILEGEADVLVDTPQGAVKVATLGRNDIIGEIAVLCDVPRTATVVAQSELETLRVSKDGFFHLVTQFPQVALEVMSEIASRLHSTTQALTEARARLDELDKRSSGG
ncbi:MAG TPA: cyclic nucleotide-binding domain-containing protein [Geminicoccaceae bacterium]|jgi:CRP-like cAMP-binding protein|nr:cyclic nucleotide-binding domain-containing protein [Geminicoccaceae bacterium]